MGRPKGSRNKLSEAFLAAMYADWESNGEAVIQTVRRDRPEVYLKIVASLLPAHLNVKASEIDELTDEQLNQQLAAVIRELAQAGFNFCQGTEAEATPLEAGELPSIH